MLAATLLGVLHGPAASGTAEPSPGTSALVAAGDLSDTGAGAALPPIDTGAGAALPDEGAGPSWSAVAAGGNHTCGVRTPADGGRGGTLWCWGANENGQLGDGTTTSRSVPVQIGRDTDWVQVGAGPDHTCGVRTPADGGRGGTLWCWGANENGQLGDGTTTSRSVPVQVGRDTDWTGATPGTNRTCGIRGQDDDLPGGTLWCWGANENGQLGDGTTTSRSVPVQVGRDTDWVQVSPATDHTCGVRGDVYPTGGSALCWGTNEDGQLGDGTTTDSTAPVRVGGDETWQVWFSVAAGEHHTCGLREGLTLWCWGDTAGIPVPTDPGTAPTDGAAVRVGTRAAWALVVSDGRRACALHSDSTLWCWTPGTVDLGGPALPEQATPLARWAVPSMGGRHLCAIRIDGTLWCWGTNAAGQVGDGTTTDRAEPVLLGGPTRWRSVATGPEHVCGIRTDSTLWCWGYDDTGRLGVPGLEDVGGSPLPVRVGTERDWTAVTTGGSHTCALRADRALWCWGAGDDGQLGTGAGTGSAVPVPAAGAMRWLDVSAGDAHTCGVRTDGTLWCWGDNVNGQLGTGAGARQREPVQVGTARDWTRVTGGGAHTCGLRADGGLWCWGNNGDGRLGDGTDTPSRVPVRIAEAAGWSAVSAGVQNTCGVRTDGTLWCWGANGRGQIGDGTRTARPSPARVGTASDWTTVAVGSAHACALRIDGTPWCWGGDTNGPPARADIVAGTPTPVPGIPPGSAVTAGGDRSCGVETDGGLWCHGQLLTPQGLPLSMSMGSKWT